MILTLKQNIICRLKSKNKPPMRQALHAESFQDISFLLSAPTLELTLVPHYVTGMFKAPAIQLYSKNNATEIMH